MTYTKGTGPVSANFAKGGDCITTKSRFLKTPNTFQHPGTQRLDYDKKSPGGEMSKMIEKKS